MSEQLKQMIAKVENEIEIAQCMAEAERTVYHMTKQTGTYTKGADMIFIYGNAGSDADTMSIYTNSK